MQSDTLVIFDAENMGPQLRKIRQKKGISITEVAERSGVTISFICKAEHGRTPARLTTLISWCKALGFKQIIFNTEQK